MSWGGGCQESIVLEFIMSDSSVSESSLRGSSVSEFSMYGSFVLKSGGSYSRMSNSNKKQ